MQALLVNRFTTSPSQNTGIEIPISPASIRPRSITVPRKAAASVPAATDITTQITAAPPTSDSVTGAAAATAGTTRSPRLTKLARSRVTNSFSIMRMY